MRKGCPKLLFLPATANAMPLPAPDVTSRRSEHAGGCCGGVTTANTFTIKNFYFLCTLKSKNVTILDERIIGLE